MNTGDSPWGLRDQATRLSLGHLPTPLEPLPRLTAHLGGPTVYVKRDDCTGLAGGGNKTRKLEFLLAEAVSSGADTVLTAGALQSNHARQTAAACAKLGLRCELLLKRSVPSRDEHYERTANLLVDRLMGARVHILPSGTDLAEALERRAVALSEGDRRAYVVPVGGSDAVGALGYAHCAHELLEQAADLGLRIDAVVHASASGGTQAGLAAGFAGLGSSVRLVGVSVGSTAAGMTQTIERIAEAVCRRLGTEQVPDEIEIDYRFVGEGYGIPTPEGVSAIELAARLEGLLLDPVYSGKAMAGLLRMVDEGSFAPSDNVVFLHTGGWPALFAYEEEFA